MTFVGKILVIVIMAFSLLFLGFSMVVFTTSKNWVVATKAEQKKVEDLNKKLTDAKAKSDEAKKGLDDAKADYEQKLKQLQNQLTAAQDENTRYLAQVTTYRGQVGVATQTAKSTLDEVEAKRTQTNQLREVNAAVEKQANEYKLQQAELNDKIREHERSNATMTKVNSELRETVAKFAALLQKHGLSTDISQIKGLESPPPVVGEVKRVDPTNKRIEMTIGSDDGLVIGHELFLYRVSPRPEYLGKVAVVQVDPDQAVAKVIGGTYLGKKIKEGDIVSSTIKPRF
jgi:chromosome segregation ATPase